MERDLLDRNVAVPVSALSQAFDVVIQPEFSEQGFGFLCPLWQQPTPTIVRFTSSADTPINSPVRLVTASTMHSHAAAWAISPKSVRPSLLG